MTPVTTVTVTFNLCKRGLGRWSQWAKRVTVSGQSLYNIFLTEEKISNAVQERQTDPCVIVYDQ